MINLGRVPKNVTLKWLFDTFSSSGGSVTCTGWDSLSLA